jgi:hypothetical protein
MLMARIQSQWFIISIAGVCVFVLYLLHPQLTVDPSHRHLKFKKNKAMKLQVSLDDASNDSFVIEKAEKTVEPETIFDALIPI